MTTKTEVAKLALVRAGVVAYDETPTDEQSAQAQSALESLHEYWVDQGMARWELVNIPVELREPLADVVAYAVANAFGVSAERYQRLMLANSRAELRIAAYNEVPYSGETVIQEY